MIVEQIGSRHFDHHPLARGIIRENVQPNIRRGVKYAVFAVVIVDTVEVFGVGDLLDAVFDDLDIFCSMASTLYRAMVE